MRLLRLIGCLAAIALAGCGGDDGGSAARAALPPPASLETCSRVFYDGERSGDERAARGSGRPDVLLVSDFPLQGTYSNDGVQATHAVRLVLEEQGFRAGEHTVGYVSCDGSTATDAISPAKCRHSARAYRDARSVVGVIGSMFSSCMIHQLPITNRAGLAVAGASNTYVGLTRGGPGIADDEPERYYPTGRRNLVRLPAPDDMQGRAHSLLAKQAGIARAFVLHDGLDAYSLGSAIGFRDAAERAGIEVVGLETWDPEASRYGGLAREVARSGAEAVFLGGYITSNAGPLIRALRERLGPDARLMATEAMLPVNALVSRAGDAAEGMLITLSQLPNERLEGAGAEFLARFRERTHQDPCCYTVHVAEATHVLLDAISATDGSREAVTAALPEVTVRDGIIGSFGFDENGDVTNPLVSVYRISGGEQVLFDVLNAP
ncbi:MAG: branched-chain amino acid ABC transporter substrate-binding protein [Solirubrobacteraceae bacterium]